MCADLKGYKIKRWTLLSIRRAAPRLPRPGRAPLPADRTPTGPVPRLRPASPAWRWCRRGEHRDSRLTRISHQRSPLRLSSGHFFASLASTRASYIGHDSGDMVAARARQRGLFLLALVAGIGLAVTASRCRGSQLPRSRLAGDGASITECAQPLA